MSDLVTKNRALRQGSPLSKCLRILEVTMAYRRSIHSIAGLIFCLLASFACHAVLAAEPKRVLMLHSFGRDFKPWSEYAQSIRAELQRQSPWPLDVTDHSLISARSS